MTWQYGDYTDWNWAIRDKNRPRRCRTRAMKTCQKRVNRVVEFQGSDVVEVVRIAKAKSTEL